MAKQPKLPLIHDMLLKIGYKCEQHEEEIEEVGDAESGPELDWCPAHTVYESETTRLIFDENGNIVHGELRDLEAEKFFEGMCG